MIQNFEDKGGPELGRENLPKLRAVMAAQSLDGFIIPHEDEYQNEYLPACNERLMWASGFTGSAGAAVVMQDKAAMFVDGRYTLQLAAQVDETLFEFHRVEDNGQVNWLTSNVAAGARIGYDPRLHSVRAVKSLEAAVTRGGGMLVPVESNPIDSAWTDRPAPPLTKVVIQPLEYAGESLDDKCARIGESLKDCGLSHAVITAPASIAWLLNIRGRDVMCTPLPLSTAIIDHDGQMQLFIHPDKLSPEIHAHLGNRVSVHDESDIETALTALKGQRVGVDPNTAAAWYSDRLAAAGAHPVFTADPVAMPKACKNAAEIAATQEAHRRDAVALVRFLHWLDTTAQSGKETEISAAQALEGFRHDLGALTDLSFETISGAGSNGAIVHYRVSDATNATLAKDTLYLVDSGAQYIDGTTDVTRTVPIGTPTEEMRRHYTFVLKGHIALATIRFPHGTSGHQLDVLARSALWNHGLDYDHGTGHGVGVYLGVHEGPQRIAKTPNAVPLKPGMIVSNEPGFYKTGAYGIRIENLQFVHDARPIDGGDREMLGFETLTLAPFNKKLIDINLLSDTEIAYVNRYHARVWAEISQLISKDSNLWLQRACKSLSKS